MACGTNRNSFKLVFFFIFGYFIALKIIIGPKIVGLSKLFKFLKKLFTPFTSTYSKIITQYHSSVTFSAAALDRSAIYKRIFSYLRVWGQLFFKKLFIIRLFSKSSIFYYLKNLCKPRECGSCRRFYCLTLERLPAKWSSTR